MENITMDDFVKSFLTALEDTRVVDRFRLILHPSIMENLEPVTGALKTTVADLQQTVCALQSTIKKKDDEILNLRREVAELRSHTDDLEQHSRRASIRVFGVPESTPGSTDDKLLDLCNGALGLQPPLDLGEIEVSHRVGKIVEERQQSSEGETMVVAKPRPIIVKFVSRRTKARVMAERKKLRKLHPRALAPNAEPAVMAEEEDARGDDGDGEAMNSMAQIRRRFPKPVYIADDLTRSKAKVAFNAREMKRQGHISDTWVFDSSIFIKDNSGHIKKIAQQDDLKKYMPR